MLCLPVLTDESNVVREHVHEEHLHPTQKDSLNGFVYPPTRTDHITAAPYIETNSGFSDLDLISYATRVYISKAEVSVLQLQAVSD